MARDLLSFIHNPLNAARKILYECRTSSGVCQDNLCLFVFFLLRFFLLQDCSLIGNSILERQKDIVFFFFVILFIHELHSAATQTLCIYGMKDAQQQQQQNYDDALKFSLI